MEFVLTGKAGRFDVTDVVTSAQVEHTIDGAGTVTLNLAVDTLSGVATVDSTLALTVDGQAWTLVAIERRSRRDWTLTFEPYVTAALKALTKPTVTQRNTSRRAFISKLLEAADPPVDDDVLLGEPYNDKSNVELTTDGGTYWDASRQAAEDIGRRLFVRSGDLWLASDDWLLDREPATTLRHGERGVGDVAWSIDVGQDVQSVSATLDDPGSLLVGDAVKVQGEGPANGLYVVESMSGSLFRPTRGISLVRPGPTIPEPTAAESSGSAGSSSLSLGALDVSGTGGGGSGRVSRFISTARRATGKRYIWGGASLSGADCSGLVVAALRAIGINAPRFTSHTIKGYGRTVSVSEGIRTPGAILHRSGHVAISLGNGRTFEASSRRRPIGELNANGRGFTSAVLLKWLF